MAVVVHGPRDIDRSGSDLRVLPTLVVLGIIVKTTLAHPKGHTCRHSHSDLGAMVVVHLTVLKDLKGYLAVCRGTRSGIRVVLPMGYLALAVQLRGHSRVVELDENGSR